MRLTGRVVGREKREELSPPSAELTSATTQPTGPPCSPESRAARAAAAAWVENIRMAYVFYENGLSINVMYTIDDLGKRAVGFRLADGMEVPSELASFKSAQQRSKLAGTIRGPCFVIRNEY
jgi:hypothetical protein